MAYFPFDAGGLFQRVGSSVVMNRPSDGPLPRALPGVAAAIGGGATAFIGGPVPRQAVLALSQTACEASPPLGRGRVSRDTADALKERLASGADERKSAGSTLGYAGWRAARG